MVDEMSRLSPGLPATMEGFNFSVYNSVFVSFICPPFHTVPCHRWLLHAGGAKTLIRICCSRREHTHAQKERRKAVPVRRGDSAMWARLLLSNGVKPNSQYQLCQRQQRDQPVTHVSFIKHFRALQLATADTLDAALLILSIFNEANHARNEEEKNSNLFRK